MPVQAQKFKKSNNFGLFFKQSSQIYVYLTWTSGYTIRIKIIYILITRLESRGSRIRKHSKSAVIPYRAKLSLPPIQKPLLLKKLKSLIAPRYDDVQIY
jgi:hypothetical protein